VPVNYFPLAPFVAPVPYPQNHQINIFPVDFCPNHPLNRPQFFPNENAYFGPRNYAHFRPDQPFFPPNFGFHPIPLHHNPLNVFQNVEPLQNERLPQPFQQIPNPNGHFEEFNNVFQQNNQNIPPYNVHNQRNDDPRLGFQNVNQPFQNPPAAPQNERQNGFIPMNAEHFNYGANELQNGFQPNIFQNRQPPNAFQNEQPQNLFPGEFQNGQRPNLFPGEFQNAEPRNFFPQNVFQNGQNMFQNEQPQNFQFGDLDGNHLLRPNFPRQQGHDVPVFPIRPVPIPMGVVHFLNNMIPVPPPPHLPIGPHGGIAQPSIIRVFIPEHGWWYYVGVP